jgi:multidrug resistance efflux pump
MGPAVQWQPSSSFGPPPPIATLRPPEALQVAEAKRDRLFDEWKRASALSVELWRRFEEQGRVTDELLQAWTRYVAIQDDAMVRMARHGYSLHKTPPAGDADFLAFQRGSAAIDEIQFRLRVHKRQLEPLRREVEGADRTTRETQQALETAQQEVDRLRMAQARF